LYWINRFESSVSLVSVAKRFFYISAWFSAKGIFARDKSRKDSLFTRSNRRPPR